MKNLNTKCIDKDELYKYLGKRAATNNDITDESIADIFSDPDAMILAADNKTCDQINSFMAKVQIGESEILKAN